jgi:phosphatidylglycerophosphate synthase
VSEPQPEVTGRRPLKTRQWPVFQKLAARMASAGLSPNAISIWSIVFGIAAGLSLAATSGVSSVWIRGGLFVLSAVFIQLRLICNLLDGMVAVEGGRKSAVGDLYNEVPDRISDPAILIGAGFAWGSCPILGFTAALLALFVAYVRAIGASVGAGQVFLGPMAKPQRMAVMTAASVLSAFISGQFAIPGTTTELGICGLSLLVICLGGLVTSIRRLKVIAGRMRDRSGDAG